MASTAVWGPRGLGLHPRTASRWCQAPSVMRHGAVSITARAATGGRPPPRGPGSGSGGGGGGGGDDADGGFGQQPSQAVAPARKPLTPVAWAIIAIAGILTGKLYFWVKLVKEDCCRLQVLNAALRADIAATVKEVESFKGRMVLKKEVEELRADLEQDAKQLVELRIAVAQLQERLPARRK
ncbi:hypothetical protein D9Q98_004364 [Chlorella vulgaris]|uniref:Uncharacterized protein n=1 Tax=Chlorella vulgaris TaxID=3077 RepID=A0A9D4TPN0_CHLVU|nr:hypothetical protein D9Q98_004364 [Chlorella vulgaris]